MEENISIEPIKLSDVERMVDSIRKNVGDVDVDLSFEFMLTAFFPTCWNNVQDALNRQYTLGYIAGLRESNKAEKIEEDLECFCE
jgi:hypothetical protein